MNFWISLLNSTENFLSKLLLKSYFESTESLNHFHHADYIGFFFLSRLSYGSQKMKPSHLTELFPAVSRWLALPDPLVKLGTVLFSPRSHFPTQGVC